MNMSYEVNVRTSIPRVNEIRVRPPVINELSLYVATYMPRAYSTENERRRIKTIRNFTQNLIRKKMSRRNGLNDKRVYGNLSHLCICTVSNEIQSSNYDME